VDLRPVLGGFHGRTFTGASGALLSDGGRRGLLGDRQAHDGRRERYGQQYIYETSQFRSNHISYLAEGAGSTSREKEDAYRNYLRMWKRMNKERKDTKQHYSKGLFGAVGGGFMLQVATNTKNLVQNAGVVAFDTQADSDHA